MAGPRPGAYSPSPASTPAPTSSNPSPPATPSSSTSTVAGDGGGGGSSSRSHGHGSNARHDRHRAAAASAAAVHPSILQPRVAVVLNVPPLWHPWLFALRLLSCAPAAWWGLPSLLHLLLRFLPGPEYNGFAPSSLRDQDMSSPPYALTETALATIWVGWNLLTTCYDSQLT